MKKFLTLITALMLLTAALPALSEEAPATLSTAAFIAGLNAMTGQESEWVSVPGPDGLTVSVPAMGSPALTSSGDALVTVTSVSAYDPEDMQGTFDGVMFQLMCAFGPILIATGTPAEEVFTPLAAFLNAEGFIPGVISVLTTGEPFSFTFEGYACTVSIETVGEALWVSLFMIVDPALMPAE